MSSVTLHRSAFGKVISLENLINGGVKTPLFPIK